MHGHRVNIWRRIYHNENFSHVQRRQVILHSEHRYLDNKRALCHWEVVLAKAEETIVHDALKINASQEHIHSIDYLGVAREVTSYEYDKD